MLQGQWLQAGFSVGRVMTPTLRLVAEREKASHELRATHQINSSNREPFCQPCRQYKHLSPNRAHRISCCPSHGNAGTSGDMLILRYQLVRATFCTSKDEAQRTSMHSMHPDAGFVILLHWMHSTSYAGRCTGRSCFI